MTTEFDHLQRTAVLETKVDAIQDTLQEIKGILDEVKPLIWKASGAISLLIILVNVLFGFKVS